MAKSSDYPDLPPGVKIFDPRRFKRHARKQGMLSEIINRERRAKEAEAKAHRLAETLAKRQGEGEEERRRRTFLGRVEAFLSRAHALLYTDVRTFFRGR